MSNRFSVSSIGQATVELILANHQARVRNEASTMPRLALLYRQKTARQRNDEWNFSEMIEPTYDYIVIGAGSAGSAIASRLTENGRHRVLLLEAGGKTHPLSQVPISFVRFINRPGVNWLYNSEPNESTGGRAIPVPRGRMVGGSSAINGMV